MRCGTVWRDAKSSDTDLSGDALHAPAFAATNSPRLDAGFIDAQVAAAAPVGDGKRAAAADIGCILPNRIGHVFMAVRTPLANCETICATHPAEPA